MASVQINEAITMPNDETLCVICKVRKIQGKGRTCHNPPCKRKGGVVRNLMNSFKSQQDEKKLRYDGPEQMAEKEEAVTLCTYCETRPIKHGRTVCLTPSCVAKYAAAKFPPRVVKVSTVHEENDSSGNESEESEDDGSFTDSASMGTYSNVSSDFTDGDAELSEEETMDGRVDNEEINDSEETIEDNNDVSNGDFCENCHRQPLFEADTDIDVTTLPYYFDLKLVDKESVRFRRLFSNLSKRDYDHVPSILLCTHCATYLTKNDREADTKEVKFPGYFWKLHSKTFLEMEEERNKLWLIMPDVWRGWWQQSFERAGVDLPVPLTREIGITQLRFAEGVKGELKCLMHMFDTLLKPLVLCPWGCTEYYHRCGHIGFDLILQQHFRHLDIPLLSDKKTLSKALTSRLDFIRDGAYQYESLLMNPSWTPFPSITWVPKIGPVFATCRNHDKGTEKKYFHLPRYPEYPAIAARKPDQLCHAVLKPRTLRSMKRSVFNTSYETVEMRGVFGGIDTCNVTEFGNFNFMSHLTERNECLSIRKRPDIRALVNMLAAQGVLYAETARNFLARAEDYFATCNFERYMRGATYMTMEDCVSLQKMLNSEDSFMIRQSSSETLDRSKSYTLLWPKVLVWIHPSECQYGARFNEIPPLRSRNRSTQLLWFLVSMLTTIPEIWSLTVKTLQYRNQWNGWLLRFSSVECLNIRKRIPRGQGKEHPFRKIAYKASDLLDKLGLTLQGFSFRSQEIIRIFRDMRPFVICLPLCRNTMRSFWSRISSVTEVCILYRNENCDIDDDHLGNCIPYELNHCNGQHRFELVWIGLEVEGESVSNWKGNIFVRHGNHFPKWWQQNRGGKPFQYRGGTTTNIDVNWTTLTYLVLVRRNKADVRKMQQEYLTYIGGQSKVFCSTHGLPLIVTPRARGSTHDYKCYEVHGNQQPCGRNVDFRCSMPSCCTWICKNCMEIKQRENGRHDIQQHPNASLGEVRVPNILDISTDYEDTAELQDNFLDLVNPNREHNLHDVEDYLVVNPELPLDDIHDVQDQSEEQNAFEFPSTNSGEQGIQVRHAENGESNYQIPCHIILNQCGTLLIRRDKELRGSKKEQFMLQKLVSSSSTTIPLLYPEGMLFPSIFFSSARDGYSLIGAIPSAILGQQGHVTQNGFATLRDHARTRFTMYSSLSAVDWRYKTFMFDALANAALNNRDSRLVMHRGFEPSKSATGLAVRNSKDGFLTDMIESRRIIQELSAAEKVNSFTLFFSLTCNQTQQPGLREFRAWVNGGGWKEHYWGFHDLTYRDQREVEDQVDQAASGLIQRTWLEILKLFLDHVEKSNNPRLFCEVQHFFAKIEYQDAGNKKALGNLPHLHMMLCTKEKPYTPEGRAALEKIICATAEDIIHDADVQYYVDEGIFQNIPNDIWELRQDVQSKLGHGICTPRCLERIGPGDQDFRCRVPDNFFCSPNHTCHSYSERQPAHTEEALEILLELLLLEGYDNGFTREYKALHPSLRSLQHFPPTMRSGERISPAVPLLFVFCRGNQNIQIIATYQTGRYIEKYINKIDENNVVFLSVHSKEEFTAMLKATFLHNTKISGSAMHEEIAIQRQKNARHPRARGKSLMEIEQLVLGYPTNYTSLRFVHVSTHPMEERKGFERSAPIQKINDARRRRNEDEYNTVEDMLDTSLAVISCRASLVPWRRFSVKQEITIKDNLFSTVTLDKITRFSARPPELRPFDRVFNYFSWFSISKERITKEEELSIFVLNDLELSTWIDGFGNVIEIRASAIPHASQYLEQYTGPNPPTEELKYFFRNLRNLWEKSISSPEGFSDDGTERQEWLDLKSRVVDQKWKGDVPVVVFSTIKPKNTTRFMVHMLLSMGQFETEYDLLSQPSIKAAFVKSHLFNDIGSDEDRHESFQQLFKRYITEELAFYPVSTRSFDYYLLQARQMFYQVLIEDEVPIFEIPPVLFTSLRRECSESVVRELRRIKEIHVDVCLKELQLLPDIPSKHDLMDVITKDNPRNWTAQFPRDVNTQSLDSYTEQSSTISTIRNAILNYAHGGNVFTKSLIINGPPGCGKTFLMMVASLLALTTGLVVTPSALMAERASALGGTYIHRLFLIPPNNYTPQRLAEVAISRILRRPALLEYLLILDVLCWDEVGQNAAQLLATCDMIMRKLRGSDLFFGGVLLICTLDHLQLRPIKGIPFLLSPHIMTCFRMLQLKHLVRSAHDPNLQRVIDICRMTRQQYEDNPTVIDELKELLRTHCTWVDNWDSPEIPRSATRCFGMRTPAHEAEARYINQVERECASSGSPFLRVNATDLQMPQQSHASWTSASPWVVSELNRLVKEPENLAMFDFAVYEFTFNMPGEFSQTQLAVLCEVPAQETVDHYRPIQVLCAPPGTKYIDFEIESKQQLVGLGWVERSVGAAPQHNRSLRRGMKARRQQYGLRPHVSNTFHGAMGATLCKMATEVNVRGSGNQLWEKGQVVVLVSRTKCCKDLIFVGNQETTLEVIAELIQVRSQYDQYIEHVLQVLSNQGNPTTALDQHRVIDDRHHFLRSNDIPLPEAGTGCCYLLVSTKNFHVTYIGQTMRALATRLREHNEGQGSAQTKPQTLRPWGLLAFVAGFDCDRDALKSFEQIWEEKRFELFRHRRGEVTTDEIVSLGTNLMSDEIFESMNLRMVIKGQIIRHQE